MLRAISAGPFVWFAYRPFAQGGGDIDLLIETQLQDPARVAKAHTQFLFRIYTALGEKKIDVLIDYLDRQSQATIYQVAKQGL